jgi:CDGSH-type Zn-finger protein
MRREMLEKNPEPIEVEVAEGKSYYWCICGLSQKKPFCDGSHKFTELSPLKYTADTTKTLVMCGCSNSEHLPFCDGTVSKVV